MLSVVSSIVSSSSPIIDTGDADREVLAQVSGHLLQRIKRNKKGNKNTKKGNKNNKKQSKTNTIA
jgi:hypothetical protein